MVIYVNSSFHHLGNSTLSYVLTKMYGNWMSQRSLLISLGDNFFLSSSCISYPEGHEFPGLQMMVNKSGGAGSFMSSCFKMEDTVFYYAANNVPMKSESDLDMVRRLITKAKNDFGFIVVDGGCKVNSFTDVASVIDTVVITAPPDIQKLKQTRESVIHSMIRYEDRFGVAFKPNIVYVVPNYDNVPSRTKIQNALQATSANCRFIRYSRELHDKRNERDLDYYITDLLGGTRTSDQRLLLVDYRQLLDKLSNIKLPSKKIKKEVTI